MDFSTIRFFGLAALIPVIVLCVYIYKKDRAEKEPLGLLLLLFFLGVATAVPAVYLERALSHLNTSLFAPLGEIIDGETYLSTGVYTAYQSLNAFIVTALIEEGLKWLVLFFVTRKNKNFNSLFDGIIYSVFVSLGFAAIENILYVFSALSEGAESAVTTASLRAVASIPGHMFFAVFMGVFYTKWHAAKNAHLLERAVRSLGYLTPSDPPGKFNSNASLMLALSLIVPILAHGLYDFGLFVGETWGVVLTYSFLAVLYVVCFILIRKMSKQDSDDLSIATAMVFTRFPALSSTIRQSLSENPSQEGTGEAQPAAVAAQPVQTGAAPSWYAPIRGSVNYYAPPQQGGQTYAPERRSYRSGYTANTTEQRTPGSGYTTNSTERRPYRSGYPTHSPIAITGNPADSGNVTVALSGGDYYGGQMTDGKADGYGIYYYANGKNVVGFWKDGKLIG